jgi:hypothetical protein
MKEPVAIGDRVPHRTGNVQQERPQRHGDATAACLADTDTSAGDDEAAGPARVVEPAARADDDHRADVVLSSAREGRSAPARFTRGCANAVAIDGPQAGYHVGRAAAPLRVTSIAPGPDDAHLPLDVPIAPAVRAGRARLARLHAALAPALIVDGGRVPRIDR